MKTKDLFKQLAFDIFDVNNDNRISDGDIFRIFKTFISGETDIATHGHSSHSSLTGGHNSQDIFEAAFQTDLVTLTKYLTVKKQTKDHIEQSKIIQAKHGGKQSLLKGNLHI
jgi:hypothetical protein